MRFDEVRRSPAPQSPAVRRVAASRPSSSQSPSTTPALRRISPMCLGAISPAPWHRRTAGVLHRTVVLVTWMASEMLIVAEKVKLCLRRKTPLPLGAHIVIRHETSVSKALASLLQECSSQSSCQGCLVRSRRVVV